MALFPFSGATTPITTILFDEAGDGLRLIDLDTALTGGLVLPQASGCRLD